MSRYCERPARAYYELGSYGLTLAIALGTICAMVWIFLLAVGDHWWPAGLQIGGSRTLSLILSLFLSLIALWITVGSGYLIINTLISGLPNHWIRNLIYRNIVNLLASIHGLFLEDRSFTSSFLGFEPGDEIRLKKLIDGLNSAVTAAVCVTAAAGGMTLYQHPEQLKSRGKDVPENPGGTRGLTHNRLRSMIDFWPGAFNA